MGKIVHDSETPAHGQQVISACAFIYDADTSEPRVFLAKRAASWCQGTDHTKSRNHSTSTWAAKNEIASLYNQGAKT